MSARAASVLLLSAVLALSAPAAASAAPSSEVTEGRWLRLVSTSDPSAMTDMLPGDRAWWEVSARASAPEPGRIELGLSGTGDLPLTLDVRACAVAWRDGECSRGEALLRAGWVAPLDAAVVPLMSAPSDAQAHLRLDVIATAPVARGASTALRLHASGHDEQLVTTPLGGHAGTLPRTGVQLGGLVLLVLSGVLAGLAGAGLLARQPEEQDA